MKKSILIIAVSLLGLNVTAQEKVDMKSSSASTQTGVVTNQPKSTYAVKGIMMNDVDAVSDTYRNGEIAIEGDQIIVKAVNNFSRMEFYGTVTNASLTQLLAVGENLLTGETFSIELENANTGDPNDAIKVIVPSKNEIFILSYLSKAEKAKGQSMDID